MKHSKILIFALSALILGYLSYQSVDARPRQAPTNFDAVHLRCEDCATATPALLVDQASGSGAGVVSEWRVDATPVLRAPRTGGFILTAPTAVGTAQPALVVNGRGVGKLLEIQDSATPVFSISDGGALSSASGLTLSDGNLAIADFARLVPQTSITLTDAGVLTPTGTFQQVTAASGVTVTLATSGFSSGSWLIIENLSNVTVVITDTGAVMLSSNISLGQYDTASLIFDGTNWVQLDESNN